MNLYEKDILLFLNEHIFVNQRQLSLETQYSLGVINRSLKHLQQENLLDDYYALTSAAYQQLEVCKPQHAIILAAGHGIKIPFEESEIPKGCLYVKEEVLIERLIRQLHEKNIYDIYIVVGFMKENFEYLIDQYNIHLVVNEDYHHRNNLHSLKRVCDHLENTYIIPSDIYFYDNIFSKNELYSWYMVSNQEEEFSSVRVNRKRELIVSKSGDSGNKMIGVCYLDANDGRKIKDQVLNLSHDKRFNGSYWEEALYDGQKMIVVVKVIKEQSYVEMNSYFDVLNINGYMQKKKEEALCFCMQQLNLEYKDIQDFELIKNGITNITYKFRCFDDQYVLRIPYENTNSLLDRQKESNTYHFINHLSLSDEVISIDCQTGIKLSRYIDHSHICDSQNWNEVKACMMTLKEFHQMKLNNHQVIDLFERIELYENMRHGRESGYRDYKKVKEDIFSLKLFLEQDCDENVLIHMDVSPQNFLIHEQTHRVKLIDWEYAAMQNPCCDIALFAIRSLYNEYEVDRLIRIYYEKDNIEDVKCKVYCYIAICGLMWSNWCEYHRLRGIDFGHYALQQYRYAKIYYKKVKNMMDNRQYIDN